MREVRLEFRKYDGSLHWFQSTRLVGEDQYGVWLGAPVGGTWQRGDGRTYTNRQAQVLLCSPDRWWTATFNDAPAQTAVYVDVSTPAVISDGLVTAVDLDLDVRRFRDGTVRLEDEDEFADHQVRYSYPTEVIEAAQAAANWVAARIAVAEPFATAYLPYLARARELSVSRIAGDGGA
jgi:protein associated with RNAse G/E